MPEFHSSDELGALERRVGVLEKELKRAKANWLDETARRALVGLIAMPVGEMLSLRDAEYPEGTTVGQAMAQQAYALADEMLAEKERRHAG